MKTQPNNKLYSLMNLLLKPLAWVLRKQLRFAEWLIAKGCSKPIAKLIVKVLNIFIFILMLFVLFPGWQALVAMFVIVVAITGIEIEPPEQPEWRGGADGFGWYDKQTGMRVDGGSIEDEITHPKK